MIQQKQQFYITKKKHLAKIVNYLAFSKHEQQRYTIYRQNNNNLDVKLQLHEKLLPLFVYSLINVLASFDHMTD